MLVRYKYVLLIKHHIIINIGTHLTCRAIPVDHLLLTQLQLVLFPGDQDARGPVILVFIPMYKLFQNGSKKTLHSCTLCMLMKSVTNFKTILLSNYYRLLYPCSLISSAHFRAILFIGRPNVFKPFITVTITKRFKKSLLSSKCEE